MKRRHILSYFIGNCPYVEVLTERTHRRFLFGILVGVLLVGCIAAVGRNREASANALKKGSTVSVEGTVYGANGQPVLSRFAVVEAATDVGEDGGASGEVYVSTIDENGKYHLELPIGYYYFYFHYHNRSMGYLQRVTRNCVVDLFCEWNFYLVSGRAYLNSQPYRNGTLHLQRVEDDPNTNWDDAYIEVVTDENGCYEFCFNEGIYGDFTVEYMIKGGLYQGRETVNMPGFTISDYDISFTGAVSQDEVQISASPKPQSTVSPSQEPQSTASPSLQSTASPSSEPTVILKKDTVLFKKGQTFTKNGLRYRVISCTDRKKEVMVMGCTKNSTKKIVIPAAVKMKEVSFSVTRIASKAFCRLKKLESVSLGKRIQIIGKQAFYQDSSLKRIQFKTKQLKSVGKEAFIGIHYNARIVVPRDCKKKYVRLLAGKY